MTEPRLRSAVRAVVLDPADRILLVRFTFPDGQVWACPGGGIEDGESERDAIIRELAEEAGLVGFTLGPCIWRREHRLPLFGGRWDGQVERYYLVRTDAFEPMPEFSAEELASEHVTGIRWWEPEELAASTELFAPRRLPELVAALHRGEILAGAHRHRRLGPRGLAPPGQSAPLPASPVSEHARGSLGGRLSVQAVKTGPWGPKKAPCALTYRSHR